MRRALQLLLVGSAMLLAASLRAQEREHIQVGIYGDYFHLNQTTTNFAGIGARVGTGIFPHVKIEGEMAYDFDQVITENFTSGVGNSIVSRVEHTSAARRIRAEAGIGPRAGTSVFRGEGGV